jgi:hypothetical protein
VPGESGAGLSKYRCPNCQKKADGPAFAKYKENYALPEGAATSRRIERYVRLTSRTNKIKNRSMAPIQNSTDRAVPLASPSIAAHEAMRGFQSRQEDPGEKTSGD